jgi:hypothetical protein
MYFDINLNRRHTKRLSIIVYKMPHYLSTLAVTHDMQVVLRIISSEFKDFTRKLCL